MLLQDPTTAARQQQVAAVVELLFAKWLTVIACLCITQNLCREVGNRAATLRRTCYRKLLACCGLCEGYHDKAVMDNAQGAIYRILSIQSGSAPEVGTWGSPGPALPTPAMTGRP